MEELNNKKYYIFGAGGHARNTMSILSADNNIANINIVFVLKEVETGQNCIDEKSFYDDKCYLDSSVYIGIGSVGNSDIRASICTKLNAYGISIARVIAPTAVVFAQISGDEQQGLFVGVNAFINCNTVLGKMVIVNSGAVIEHDCHIGDYVHIAPNATLCGNVSIGNNTHIGAGSTLIQGVKVGSNSLIGAGSVVTSDIPSNVVAYGNPCKVVRNNE